MDSTGAGFAGSGTAECAGVPGISQEYPRGELERRIEALKPRWGRKNPGATILIQGQPLQVWPVPGCVINLPDGKHCLWLPKEVNTKFALFLHTRLRLEDDVVVEEYDMTIPGMGVDVTRISDIAMIDRKVWWCGEDDKNYWKWHWEIAIHGLNPPVDNPTRDFRSVKEPDMEYVTLGDESDSKRESNSNRQLSGTASQGFSVEVRHWPVPRWAEASHCAYVVGAEVPERASCVAVDLDSGCSGNRSCVEVQSLLVSGRASGCQPLSHSSWDAECDKTHGTSAEREAGSPFP